MHFKDVVPQGCLGAHHVHLVIQPCWGHSMCTQVLLRENIFETNQAGNSFATLRLHLSFLFLWCGCLPSFSFFECRGVRIPHIGDMEQGTWLNWVTKYKVEKEAICAPGPLRHVIELYMETHYALTELHDLSPHPLLYQRWGGSHSWELLTSYNGCQIKWRSAQAV